MEGYVLVRMAHTVVPIYWYSLIHTRLRSKGVIVKLFYFKIGSVGKINRKIQLQNDARLDRFLELIAKLIN